MYRKKAPCEGNLVQSWLEPAKDLGEHDAVRPTPHGPDADVRVITVKHVGPVPGAVHESSVSLLGGRCTRQVLTRRGVPDADRPKHVKGRAVSGGVMTEMPVGDRVPAAGRDSS